MDKVGRRLTPRDEIELTLLTDLGDLQAAEACAAAVEAAWEVLCDIIGVDPSALDREAAT